LFVSTGPVAAFVQHVWGGAYTDPIGALEGIAASYARLHVLFDGIAEESSPARWLLGYSDFRMVQSLTDLDRVRAGRPFEEASEFFTDQSELFVSLAERLPGTFGVPGMRLDW